jgi:putative ATPase
MIGKEIRLPDVPLAERMRPKSIDDYVGQKHLIGEGKPIFQMISRGVLFSMVFWGPPGSGKTTLARLLTSRIHARFEQISAVSSGVKEVRQIIGTAANRAFH